MPLPCRLLWCPSGCISLHLGPPNRLTQNRHRAGSGRATGVETHPPGRLPVATWMAKCPPPHGADKNAGPGLLNPKGPSSAWNHHCHPVIRPTGLDCPTSQIYRAARCSLPHAVTRRGAHESINSTTALAWVNIVVMARRQVQLCAPLPSQHTQHAGWMKAGRFLCARTLAQAACGVRHTPESYQQRKRTAEAY